jgi:hypothetical protein
VDEVAPIAVTFKSPFSAPEKVTFELSHSIAITVGWEMVDCPWVAIELLPMKEMWTAVFEI